VQWITKLHNNDACTQYFHELLVVVEEKMLIVLTPSQDRIQCSDLVKELRTMHTKVMNDAIYSRKPCPEKRAVKSEVAFEALLNDTAKGNIKRHKAANLSTHRGEVRASKSPDQLRALAK
jgi:hypothetical protein